VVNYGEMMLLDGGCFSGDAAGRASCFAHCPPRPTYVTVWRAR